MTKKCKSQVSLIAYPMFGIAKNGHHCDIWEKIGVLPYLVRRVQELLSPVTGTEACSSHQMIINDRFEILDSSELLPNEQKTGMLGVLMALLQF